jgi:SAM-dependent methyltransferase
VLAAMDPYGDFAKEHVLNGVMLRMLGDVSGKRVLDAGCGHGYFSRLLAGRGAQVVGVEPASSLFEFSLTHPCFENVGSSWLEDGSVIVREYLREYEISVPYAADLHRPLSQYINHVLFLGCDLLELSEPGLDPAAAIGGPAGVTAYVHVPPFVIVAARRHK